VESVAVIYGTWLAGGVVVPLNPQARGREVATQAIHAGARCLIHDMTYRDLDAVTSATTGSTIDVLAVTDLVAANPPSVPAVQASAPDAAMLIYTSGTTGRPKGVVLSHGNLKANVDAIVTYLELTSDDSVLSVLPFNYSYGNSVLHTHLAVGGTIVLEKNLVFPHAIVDTMAREQVTGFSGVPSTFALLLSRVDLAAAQLGALRYVTQAGAAMPVPLIDKLRKALPRTKVFVMYGQTEATARLTYVPPGRLTDKPGSAGIPIPGVTLAIRNEHGQDLHTGETGEVWARGANVMQGYWRDDAATRAVLVDGWLKTGDVGHLDEEGFLFLAGRRSDIIKTGAHRVHPLEVEEAIAGLPGVREVAVAGIDDEMLGQSIAAFVVAESGSGLTPERVKARCRDTLAPYKIPKLVEMVAALPRTASGKLRRNELSSTITKDRP
jgi:acyl-CoA synthetase (AMP-forming)/AMP-acid ligase II